MSFQAALAYWQLPIHNWCFCINALLRQH